MPKSEATGVVQLPGIDFSRDATIARIKSALERRSGRKWSVRGGSKRATDYGWITITAPPKRLDEQGCLTALDRQQLASLLGFETEEIGVDGEDVPAQTDYREEYIDRAEGRRPLIKGVPLWD